MALTFVSRANAVPTIIDSSTCQSATQAHTAKNLLVALLHMDSGQVTSMSNLAGDTWVKSTLSPYLPGTIHHHEVWYVLQTKGHPADILTVVVTSEVELGITIYEFTPANATLQALYVGDAAANLQVDGGTPPTINSGPIGIVNPSVIFATYRNSIGAPTSPSGTQSVMHQLNAGGTVTLYDSYQAAIAPAAVTAVAGANNSFPQWTILAAAFAESVGTVINYPVPIQWKLTMATIKAREEERG